MKKWKTASTCFRQSSFAKIVEASIKISLMIAKEKKLYKIGETLIKPCMLKELNFVSGKTDSNKIAKISHSDSTIKSSN